MEFLLSQEFPYSYFVVDFAPMILQNSFFQFKFVFLSD